jgi:hypothetical protein
MMAPTGFALLTQKGTELLVDFGFNHNCGRGLMGMDGASRQGDKVLLILFIVAQLLDSGGDLSRSPIATVSNSATMASRPDRSGY